MRTGVVSGDGTGIGRETARAFARVGDEIRNVGRRPHALAEASASIKDALGRSAVHAHTADVTPAIDARLAELPDEVAVLVNSAGGAPPDAALPLSVPESQLSASLRSNLFSAASLAEPSSPRLARPGGRVVNLRSIAALHVGGKAFGSGALTGRG